MNSLFLSKLSIIKEDSINLSRNYLNNDNNTFLNKPILSFQDDSKRNSNNNNINNSIKLSKTRNLFLKKLTKTNNTNEIKNYYYSRQKILSLEKFDKNIKLDNKKMRLKKEMKSLSRLKLNISKSNTNINDFPNIKVNNHNSLNSFNSINNSNTIDNDLFKSSSTKKIENIFLIDDKKLFQNKLIPIKRKKEDIINIFRKNKLTSKLTLSSINETNINSKSQKEQIENSSQQLSLNLNSKQLKETSNSFFDKTNTDRIESKVKKDIIENKIKLILRRNSKTNENNKEENNEENELILFKSTSLINIKWKIPKIKKAIRKKIIEEILNYFLSEIPPKNKKLDYKKKLLKRSKTLIHNNLILKINNNLSIKSPYEDKKSYFNRIKKEFLKESQEEKNFDHEFITSFKKKNKEEISIKINYSNHLAESYFNYKKEFLDYLFYGNKKGRRRAVLVTHAYTSKTKSFFYHLTLKNLIFINKFFLNDNVEEIKKEIRNSKTKIKKFPRRLSNLSDLILNPPKEVNLEKMRFQIYNFKRICNKLEKISILKRKENLNRIKKKKSIIYQKEINSEMVFRCLCYYIYYNDSKEFIKCFLQFNDIIDIEQTDSKYNTLLTLSVKYHCFEIFKFLIEKGANVNTQNIYLNTPLHYAFGSKLYKFIDLLIINGADENLKNVYGKNYFDCVNIEEN